MVDFFRKWMKKIEIRRDDNGIHGNSLVLLEGASTALYIDHNPKCFLSL